MLPLLRARLEEVSSCSGSEGGELLRCIADTIEDEVNEGVLASPRIFFSFEGTCLTLPPLSAPCFGAAALSVWAWIRVDPVQGDGRHQLICGVHGSGGGFEVLIINGVVSLRTLTAKGGISALQAPQLLSTGQWHMIVVEHAAPTRRLLPFARSQGSGTVRLFVDGALEIEGPLEFPSPTSALRICSIGGRGASTRSGDFSSTGSTESGERPTDVLNGQIAELLLLPSLSGAGAVSSAAMQMRQEPPMSMHEAAACCGLRASLSLHPAALTVQGAPLLSAAQMGLVDETASLLPSDLASLLTPRNDATEASHDATEASHDSTEASHDAIEASHLAAGSCPPAGCDDDAARVDAVRVDAAVRVCRRSCVRDALVSLGGVRVPLLLLAHTAHSTHSAHGRRPSNSRPSNSRPSNTSPPGAPSHPSTTSPPSKLSPASKPADLSRAGAKRAERKYSPADLIRMLRCILWRRPSMYAQVVPRP